jgi:hypothetical protein
MRAYAAEAFAWVARNAWAFGSTAAAARELLMALAGMGRSTDESVARKSGHTRPVKVPRTVPCPSTTDTKAILCVEFQ